MRTHEIVATAAEAAAGDVGEASGLVPVYRASARISTRVLRRLAEDALASAIEGVEDPVPAHLRVERRLPLRRDAIAAGHRPRRLPDVEVARRRLAYEELLLLQLALLAHRPRGRRRRRRGAAGDRRPAAARASAARCRSR